jgi:hypothetical protein
MMNAARLRTTKLLDDRTPGIRSVLAALLPTSSHADFAVARIRLSALDLSPGELGTMRCRVLLGRLEVDSLEFVASEHSEQERVEHLNALISFARSGRLRVRVCCLEEWNPDFSVIRTRSGSQCASMTLVGSHYFARPPIAGPAFTCMLPGEQPAALATRRFDSIWRRGYDVLPVIIQSLEQLRAVVMR